MSTFMPMLYSAWDSDIAYSFRKSRVAVISTLLLLAMFLAAILAPHLAPQNPFDIAELSLFDSELPPAWAEGGNPAYLLGTDTQARDVLSSIMYGMRISLVVGFASVLLAAVLGVTLGLLGGFLGGIVDAVLMRIADVLLSFPPILVALLINGVLRGALPQSAQADSALIVLILSIGLTNWVQYARTVRGSTMVLVIATINLGMAVLTEATLSFLGVGMPPTQPSLGTLIQIGNEFLFSGIWWVVVFPAAALAVLVLAVNLLGDWLRDALNPKLR